MLLTNTRSYVTQCKVFSEIGFGFCALICLSTCGPSTTCVADNTTIHRVRAAYTNTHTHTHIHTYTHTHIHTHIHTAVSSLHPSSPLSVRAISLCAQWEERESFSLFSFAVCFSWVRFAVVASHTRLTFSCFLAAVATLKKNGRTHLSHSPVKCVTEATDRTEK